MEVLLKVKKLLLLPLAVHPYKDVSHSCSESIWVKEMFGFYNGYVWCLFSSAICWHDFLFRVKIHVLELRGSRDVHLFLLLYLYLKLQRSLCH